LSKQFVWRVSGELYYRDGEPVPNDVTLKKDVEIRDLVDLVALERESQKFLYDEPVFEHSAIGKALQRENLNQHVDEYLARGGKITKYPTPRRSYRPVRGLGYGLSGRPFKVDD
jgi:hypothetical protein